MNVIEEKNSESRCPEKRSNVGKVEGKEKEGGKNKEE
jgi:hypothetical protein